MRVIAWHNGQDDRWSKAGRSPGHASARKTWKTWWPSPGGPVREVALEGTGRELFHMTGAYEEQEKVRSEGESFAKWMLRERPDGVVMRKPIKTHAFGMQTRVTERA